MKAHKQLSKTERVAFFIFIIILFLIPIYIGGESFYQSYKASEQAGFQFNRDWHNLIVTPIITALAKGGIVDAAVIIVVLAIFLIYQMVNPKRTFTSSINAFNGKTTEMVVSYKVSYRGKKLFQHMLDSRVVEGLRIASLGVFTNMPQAMQVQLNGLLAMIVGVVNKKLARAKCKITEIEILNVEVFSHEQA